MDGSNKITELRNLKNSLISWIQGKTKDENHSLSRILMNTENLMNINPLKKIMKFKAFFKI